MITYEVRRYRSRIRTRRCRATRVQFLCSWLRWQSNWIAKDVSCQFIQSHASALISFAWDPSNNYLPSLGGPYSNGLGMGIRNLLHVRVRSIENAERCATHAPHSIILRFSYPSISCVLFLDFKRSPNYIGSCNGNHIHPSIQGACEWIAQLFQSTTAGQYFYFFRYQRLDWVMQFSTLQNREISRKKNRNLGTKYWVQKTRLFAASKWSC